MILFLFTIFALMGLVLALFGHAMLGLLFAVPFLFCFAVYAAGDVLEMALRRQRREATKKRHAERQARRDAFR